MSARCAASSTPSTWMWMKLSRRPSPLRAPLKAISVPAVVALDREYRMDQQADSRPRSTELADHRIDQERHVVVDDFEHRHAARRRGRLEADLRRAGLALARATTTTARRSRRALPARSAANPRAPHARTARRGNPCGMSRLRRAERRGGRADQRLAGASSSVGAGNILDVHVRPSPARRSAIRFRDITRTTRASATAALYCRR